MKTDYLLNPDFLARKTTITTVIFNDVISFDKKTKELYCNGTIFKADEVKEIAKQYKGGNRIHKPMALNFYTDAKNGKTSNYTLIK